jgi:hypothetical protein
MATENAQDRVASWSHRRTGTLAVATATVNVQDLRVDLAVEWHARLDAAVGDELVTASIGPDGEAIALWSGHDGTRVTVHRADGVRTTELRDFRLAYPMVQTLPDDRILVVASRCQWRASGAERNAVVYDADGSVVREATLGDGIEHVQTTRTGHVWVGYFDEGVYGNRGWDEPMGAPGLLRFGLDLSQDWEFPPQESVIDDCYALNVDDDAVWTCYYSDFPLVRIRDGAVRLWRNKVARGATAITVHNGRAAFYGGYNKDGDRLVVARLGGDDLTALATYRVVRPDGSPLPKAARAVGRGAVLHVLADRDWYRFDLAMLP